MGAGEAGVVSGASASRVRAVDSRARMLYVAPANTGCGGVPGPPPDGSYKAFQARHSVFNLLINMVVMKYSIWYNVCRISG